MAKLAPYVNEIVSLLVMLLMFMALVAAQGEATARDMTASAAIPVVEVMETGTSRPDDD